MKKTSIFLLAMGIAIGSTGAPESGRPQVATPTSPAYEATHEATTVESDFHGAGFWRALACGGCIVGSVVATVFTVVGGIVVGSGCAMICVS